VKNSRIKNLVLGHIVECGVFLLKEALRTKSKDLKSFALKHFIDQVSVTLNLLSPPECFRSNLKKSSVQ
jgi:hypothetical protein